MVDFRLLGPVEVWAGERRLDAGQPRQRTVLAALLADAGRMVATPALIDRVWGEDAPPTARHSLQSHLARARRVLAAADPPVRVVSRSGGYLLDAEPGRVDLIRFRRLVGQARQAPPGERLGHLREAVALWRGEPLAGIPGAWAARMREGWTIERLDAVAEWAGAELALAGPGAVLGPLSSLVAEFPLVEPLAALLLRALAAAGRSAEALAAYATVRRRLADELGTDPGPELREVHRAILRGEPAAPPRPHTSPAPVRPAQLPADVPAFAGRTEQLARLDGLLEPRAAVTVSAVSGMAGVGKTALAVHWAHRVADRFPDGQLYVNLRGFDPGGAPVRPEDAVRGFLDAFAVPLQRIPSGLDAQTTLYRSVLAGKRVLVVLDNARDAEQVRPLLPGESGCLTVVTSRSQLTSLVAAEGARPVVVDVLPVREARDLLDRRLGAGRVAAEPEAVDRIVAACARLPLALSIAAARAQQTGFPLASVAAELDTHRLNALDAGDAAGQVRTVFSWSYETLTPPAARLFRLLGLHSGPHVGVPAAAGLAGLPAEQVRPLLAELSRAHLVAEPAAGRFALHDLLRSYAAELVRSADTEADRRAALRRMFDHYLHSAYAADRLIHPERDPVVPPPPDPAAAPATFDCAGQAWTWFTGERPVLLGAVGQAAAAGFDTHAWLLAWTLTDSLQRRGHYQDQLDTQRIALGAARRLGDPAVQVHVHRNLARAYLHLGRAGEALDHIGSALGLARDLGDPATHATIHLTFSKVLESTGDDRGALGHARSALALFAAAGNRHGQANALNSVGWLSAMLNDHRRALAYCRRALALHERLGNRIGAALTRDSVGFVRHRLGQHAEAAGDYRQALEQLRELGDRYNEAVVLDHLGDTHQAAGDHQAAHAAWRQSLTILDDLSHHEAHDVRAKLSR